MSCFFAETTNKKKGWTAGGVPAGARNRGAWRSHWARACRNARAVPDPHVPRTDLYSAGDFRFPWVFLSRAIAAFCAERPQHKGDFYNPTRCAVLVSGRKLRVGKPPSGSCTKSLGEGAAGVSVFSASSFRLLASPSISRRLLIGLGSGNPRAARRFLLSSEFGGGGHRLRHIFFASRASASSKSIAKLPSPPSPLSLFRRSAQHGDSHSREGEWARTRGPLKKIGGKTNVSRRTPNLPD